MRSSAGVERSWQRRGSGVCTGAPISRPFGRAKPEGSQNRRRRSVDGRWTAARVEGTFGGDAMRCLLVSGTTVATLRPVLILRAKRILFALALSTLLPASCLANRTVTDETGRNVIVPDHPHRIICLMPSVTDTVFALGAGDDVVAISDYTQYPAAALSKPSVGNLITPSIEK